MEYSRILLIIVAGIGDFFESLDALKTAREAFPGSRITLLVSSKVYEYARHCPYADEVVGFPVAGGRGFPGPARAGAAFSILLKLRSRKFDAAANLYEIGSAGGALRMRLMLAFIGAKKTFGRDTEGRGAFYDVKIPDRYADRKNQRFYCGRVAAALTGREPSRARPWIGVADRGAAGELLESLGIGPEEKLLVLNPGSDRPSRRWPPAYFAETAELVAAGRHVKVLVTGGAGEENLAQEIISKLTVPAVSACGRTTIGQTAAIISRAGLVITTNSAALHMAASLGVPAVAVAGSGDPWRDRPDGKTAMLWNEIECGPCSHWECPRKERNKCMNDIKPAEAAARAAELLGNGVL